MKSSLVFSTAVFAALIFGCNAVIGDRDIFLSESEATESNVTSQGDGGIAKDATPDLGPLPPAPDPEPTCRADLKTDAKNCGRCGHDCLGAPCNVGVCAPTTLATGLENPANISLSATHVYVTTYGDERVLEIPKNGGATRELAKAQTNVWGVLASGTTLYWANSHYPYEPQEATYKGGIWSCELPACATPKLVTPADFPNIIVLQDGNLYFTEENTGAVVRVKPDGTGRTTIATNTTSPFGIAADKTHVYWTSYQPQLYRAPVGGGGQETVGPQGTFRAGYIAVDADRVYWAYSERAGTGRVVSAAKNNLAAPRIEYGSEENNKEPVGIAVDDKFVYWSTHGTKDGTIALGDGQVLACPKKGCPASGPTVLMKELARAYGIAVDNTHVYVAEYTNAGDKTGSVRKVPKP